MYTAYDKEVILVSSVVMSLDQNKLRPSAGQPAQAVSITVVGAPIRYYLDGSVPSASLGHMANQGADIAWGINSRTNQAQEISIEGIANLDNFKCIRATAADATITVTYYR